MKLYTTAPISYDGFGTTTIEDNQYVTYKGQDIREVEIDDKHYDWQTMRYSSGNHFYCKPDSFGEYYSWFILNKNNKE